MSTTETWAEYESAYQAIRPKMKAFMDALAAAFGTTADEDTCGEDYGYMAVFTHNGIKYGADLQLWDAGTSNGDAEPGEMGNLHMSVCRDGGLVVIGWAPYNYTDECWVPYTDHAELLRRVPDLDQVDDCVQTISDDSLEDRGDDFS